MNRVCLIVSDNIYKHELEELNEIWDERGYERLSLIFDIEEGQQRAERGDTSGKSENRNQ